MDVPGNYHSKWSKSGRERLISYDITYMQNLKKMIQINLLTKYNRLQDLENKFMVIGGKSREEA